MSRQQVPDRFQSKGLSQFVLWQKAKVYLYEKKNSFTLKLQLISFDFMLSNKHVLTPGDLNFSYFLGNYIYMSIDLNTFDFIKCTCSLSKIWKLLVRIIIHLFSLVSMVTKFYYDIMLTSIYLKTCVFYLVNDIGDDFCQLFNWFQLFQNKSKIYHLKRGVDSLSYFIFSP